MRADNKHVAPLRLDDTSTIGPWTAARTVFVCVRLSSALPASTWESAISSIFFLSLPYPWLKITQRLHGMVDMYLPT